MTPDMVAELLRQLMREAMILAAPILIAAAALSFLLSLVQAEAATRAAWAAGRSGKTPPAEGGPR